MQISRGDVFVDLFWSKARKLAAVLLFTDGSLCKSRFCVYVLCTINKTQFFPSSLFWPWLNFDLSIHRYPEFTGSGWIKRRMGLLWVKHVQKVLFQNSVGGLLQKVGDVIWMCDWTDESRYVVGQWKYSLDGELYCHVYLKRS